MLKKNGSELSFEWVEYTKKGVGCQGKGFLEKGFLPIFPIFILTATKKGSRFITR
jgi:hypothetical protein